MFSQVLVQDLGHKKIFLKPIQGPLQAKPEGRWQSGVIGEAGTGAAHAMFSLGVIWREVSQACSCPGHYIYFQLYSPQAPESAEFNPKRQDLEAEATGRNAAGLTEAGSHDSLTGIKAPDSALGQCH
ncbi:unnamed protein product [Caretta caretta]